MAHITLHNNCDVPVYARLVWGLSEISTAHIPVGGKASLNCQLVWYDLYVSHDIKGGRELADKRTIYCNTSWVIKKKDNNIYEIVQD